MSENRRSEMRMSTPTSPELRTGGGGGGGRLLVVIVVIAGIIVGIVALVKWLI